ncbi:Cytochrome P450 [Glarea lozoyensis ATCC 20868]|uniref:Cytochrome P450 n=1 Tax=Glarea lozoyensis (strain ATCC 20868 / MF5171) TaxID=1116229 RepID=S3CXM5_GLAL2|nr:Cytochrome P450 [Glarea lozoyensis ATCC 20868]EPE30340.1 Cytochrome P450 [Glarea lozoyensis ATCC 20868]
MYLFYLLSLLSGFGLYKIVSFLRKVQQYREEASKRACFPPPTLRSTNFLGTSVLKESLKATKEDRGPQFIVEAMDRVGKNVHTLRVPVLYYEMLVTRDLENIKAIFSTSSADWDISTTRANAFMPLLGEGIFTSRGLKWKHSRAIVRPQFNKGEVLTWSLSTITFRHSFEY